MSSGSGNVLAQQVIKGDRGALAKAITLVESVAEGRLQEGQDLLETLLPKAGAGIRYGITGIPGSGKSTLIEALGLHLIGLGHRVAVLAVDPSSTRSGGSILGDKTRMEKLAVNDAAFVRPSATGGALGGVTRRTREATVLCEAAGYDRVIIETVGVGQNELAVERMTDLNIVLMLAGTGDELQGIKRGIMESADVVVLNKYDGANRKACERARNELQHAIQLMPSRANGRRPDVLLCSALEGTGIAELADHMERSIAEDRSSGAFAQRRWAQWTDWLDHAIGDGLHTAFAHDALVNEARNAYAGKVASGHLSPAKAAAELIALFRTGGAPPRG
ncbi:MAG: methylmalonyl Co-A mutase-associated GTPase MeaB [Flavobacteriales bacterium]